MNSKVDNITTSTKLGEAFGESATSLRYPTEQAAIEGAAALLQEARDYLREQKFVLAEICLDLLLEYKMWEDEAHTTPRMRRDAETPDYMHETRQVHHTRGLIADNRLPMTSKHGSVEILFCANILHDIGEDFNVTPDAVYAYLSKRINNASPHLSDKSRNAYHEMAQRVTNIMELLTMERKYSTAQINTTLGRSENSPLSRKALNEFLESIKEQSRIIRLPVPDLQIIKRSNLGNLDKPDRYIVSRSIRNDIRDWGINMKHLHLDPYAVVAKPIDRVEGMSTRIGKNFGLIGYARYLSMTEQSYSFNDVLTNAGKKFPEFEKALETLDSMMGVLYRIGRTYVNHHQERNEEGDKGFSIDLDERINFRDYFPSALYGYRKVYDGINPLSIILNRIKNSNHVGIGGQDGPALCTMLEESIRESLEANPENRGLVPTLLNKLRQLHLM